MLKNISSFTLLALTAFYSVAATAQSGPPRSFEGTGPQQRGPQGRPDHGPQQRGPQGRPDYGPQQRGPQGRPDHGAQQRGPEQRGPQGRPDVAPLPAQAIRSVKQVPAQPIKAAEGRLKKEAIPATKIKPSKVFQLPPEKK